jgi:hypothetical protein
MDVFHMDVALHMAEDLSLNLSGSAQCPTPSNGQPDTLRNKTILIISPQPWDHIAISKHHYASELAARNNTVYFLEPPNPEISCPVSIRTAKNQPRIEIISYRPSLLDKTRFHAYGLYKKIVKKRIRLITNQIPRSLDLVWSFEPNRFPDLREFKARRTIFHPVDPLCDRRQINIGRTADIVLAVSKKILSQFECHSSAHFVNHGLAVPFEAIARERLTEPYVANKPLQAGYAGNLVRPPVNRKIIREIVSQNSQVLFHFWGPCSIDSNSGSQSQVIADFIAWLQQRKNVRLHGPVAPTMLASAMRKMDLFFLSYSLHPTESDRSNSHKLLEYLSTGRVVVSSQFDTYQHLSPELFLMPNSTDDQELPYLFKQAVENISKLNNQQLRDARLRLALANRYTDQINLIEKHLASISSQIAA